MADFPMNILQQVDAQLGNALASWNIYTTILCVAFFSYLIIPVFFATEPDTHPFLIARQSSASRVRQPRESATFRSLDIPHGYPLRTGLNVKDPGAPKWSAGRDGDLRDVWRRAATGPIDKDGNPSNSPGKISTIFGREEVTEHQFDKLSADVNAVGKHFESQGCSRIAIYLSNSTELLVSLFACAFYGLTPILVPQEQTLESLAAILKEIQADTLVVGAGAVPLFELVKLYSSLEEVIWAVPLSSRHMDWNEVPEGEGGTTNVAVWHDIVDEVKQATSELPTELPGGTIPNILVLSEKKGGGSKEYEVVEYTQKNIVAAISAQMSALPHAHRMNPSDTFLPLASLTKMYALIVTMAALFSNVSIALTSVCGPKASYETIFQGVSPTIVVAHPATLSKFCNDQKATRASGVLGTFWHGRKLQTLATGVMPTISGPLQKLRLIYTFQNSNTNNAPLTMMDFSDLRIFTGARLVNAYTHSHVAGAISQTNMLDYQHHGLKPGVFANFGPPLSCVEFKIKESPERTLEDDMPTGNLLVTGPAVVGGEILVDRLLLITQSNTLASAD